MDRVSVGEEMTINVWNEYRYLLDKQRYYETLLGNFHFYNSRNKNLAYWAHKDVEAYEENVLMPYFKKNRENLWNI